MVTQATGVNARSIVGDGINSPDAVVFRGDGEPKTPNGLVDRLADIVGRRGIEPDNFSRGGVVRELETRFADLLGKEDAVFMPSGTLANHLAIRMLCNGKPRAIVQERSHLYLDTGDTVQQLSGVHLVPLAAGRTYFTLEEVRQTVEESMSGRVVTPIGALMIESPVRRQHGQIMPMEEISRVTEFCSQSGIPTHLDGARLFMMSAATGVAPADYSGMFDTVYVSLYKYFGAPFGAILAGSADFCEDLYHHRRMFGGGLSSSALAAALALDGSVGFEARFADAMAKARSLFDDLDQIRGLSVGAYEHGSNIFPLTLATGLEFEPFVERLSAHRVFVGADEHDPASFHLTVNTTVLRQTNDQIVDAFKTAAGNG